MKCRGLLRVATFFVLIVTAFAGSYGVAQTALKFGKCNDTCSPSAIDCTGGCNLTISDDGNVATVKDDSKPPKSANTICVKAGSKVNWVEPPDGKSFIVYFGNATPFVTKSSFTAGSGGTSSDNIQDPMTHPSVLKCNKYFILHCDGNKCISADPVVIVNGGHGIMSHNAAPAKSGK
jgi:hypothetical protein